MRSEFKRKAFIILTLLLNLTYTFSRTKSINSIIEQNIIVAMDSIVSPSFDSIYGELYKDAVTLNENPVWNELIKLKIFNHYLLGNTDSLLHYTELSKHYSTMINDEENYYYGWSYLINHYSLTGKVYQAIIEANKMLSEASSAQSIFGMALSRQLLGEIYLYMDLYDESLLQLNKSYEYSEQTSLAQSCLSSLCFSINVVNIYRNDYEKVFSVCNKLDSLNIITDSTKNILHKKAFNLVSMCCRTIASSRMQDFPQADIYFSKAEELFDECNMQQDFFLETEAVYYFEKGRYKESLILYDSLYNFYQKIGLYKESLRIKKEIAVTNSRMDNYREAYENYFQYEKNKDSISIDMAYQHLNQLALSNDLKNIELDKKNLLLRYEQAKSRSIIFVSIGIILVAIIIFIFYLREKQLNKKLMVSEASLKEEKMALARSETMLYNALEKAKQSDILKTAFLANISHEIRTPLNAIIGFSEMLTCCDDEESKEQFNEIIKENNTMLLKLIDDILNVSQIEADNTKRNVTEFDLAGLFAEYHENFKKKVKYPVELIYENNYKEMIVNLDKSRVIQVLVNFMSNSVKFTDKGSIRFGFEIVDNGIFIYVKDTGIGLKEEEKSRIFDKFYKVNDFTQGSGLGITLCKAIIDDCGGKIGVDSEYGGGSTFHVWVPCKISSYKKNEEAVIV